MKVLIFIIVFLIIIIIASLIGPILDRNDTKQKQMNILKEKGYKFDKNYLGKKFTKFDLYLDSKKKKILLFNGKSFVYNFKDLTNFKADKEVDNGKFKYFVKFTLGKQDYDIILKGKINENNKLKYEELVQLLSFVNNANEEVKSSKKNTSSKKETKNNNKNKSVSKKATKKVSDNKKVEEKGKTNKTKKVNAYSSKKKVSNNAPKTKKNTSKKQSNKKGE